MHARARPGRGSCSAQHLLTGALAEMKRASAAAEYPGSLSRPKLRVIWAGRTPPPFCAAGGGGVLGLAATECDFVQPSHAR